jgi:hypothetical protein
MLKFNHEGSTMGAAMGLERNQEAVLLGNMFYEIVNRDFIMHDLYDNPEEAPIELRTTSGLLESCLKRCSTENERTFTIWEFSKTDFLRSTENKNLEGMLQAVMMIYMMSDKKRDKFIEKFKDFHDKAHRDNADY